jgi:hypothetical protein
MKDNAVSSSWPVRCLWGTPIWEVCVTSDTSDRYRLLHWAGFGCTWFIAMCIDMMAHVFVPVC